MLGIDLGTRFLRGALCDLRGTIRARHDVELGRHRRRARLEAIVELRDALVTLGAVSRAQLIDGAVVGVPGVVDAGDGRRSRLATNVPGLEAGATQRDLDERLGRARRRSRTTSTSPRSASSWRGVARGVDDFVFLSIGTGLGAGLVLRGELHRGHHGAAGELDYVAVGPERGDRSLRRRRCRRSRSELADGKRPTPLSSRPTTRARSSPPRARATPRPRGRRRGGAADRAAHRTVAAVTDVELVVLGGGIGANGDLLLDDVRPLLAEWLPYPPRVEISSLGEAAVLTGALAVGLRAARENVFVNRARPRRAG